MSSNQIKEATSEVGAQKMDASSTQEDLLSCLEDLASAQEDLASDRAFVSKSRNITCPNCSEKVATEVKYKRATCGKKCRLGCLAGSFLCCFGYVLLIYI